MKYRIENTLNQWWLKYPIVRKISKWTHAWFGYGLFLIKTGVLDRRCEPPFNSWIHTFTLLMDEQFSEPPEYVESYDLIPNDAADSVTIPIQNTYLSKYTLTMVKDNERNYILLFNHRISQVYLSESRLSSAAFLSVEYSHPKMESSIVFDMPKYMFVVGNEILSCAFVYRWLVYQEKPFLFDKDYAIKIIDHNAQFVVIGYDQYIQVLENAYSVIDSHKLRAKRVVISTMHKQDSADSVDGDVGLDVWEDW